MYTVRNSEGEVALITSRKEDAISFITAGSVDKTEYIVMETTIIESNETTEGEDEEETGDNGDTA